MKQTTLKIFELENNPKFGSISTCQFLFFLLIFKAENITQEAAIEGSNFMYLVFQSALKLLLLDFFLSVLFLNHPIILY